MNLWKYPVIYLAVAGLIVGALYLLNGNHILTLTLELPDWLRPLVLLPIVIALVSTNLPDFMSKRILRRLKWLHSRAGINQLYYFVAFQGIVMITTATLAAIDSNSYVIYLFDLVSNGLGVLTAGIYIFFMLRITRNN
jgi:hypothetical protein